MQRKELLKLVDWALQGEGHCSASFRDGKVVALARWNGSKWQTTYSTTTRWVVVEYSSFGFARFLTGQLWRPKPNTVSTVTVTVRNSAAPELRIIQSPLLELNREALRSTKAVVIYSPEGKKCFVKLREHFFEDLEDSTPITCNEVKRRVDSALREGQIVRLCLEWGYDILWPTDA